LSSRQHKISWDYRKVQFTVAVTVYNQSNQEINRCVNSILNQSRKPDIIEIFDDGSSNRETLNALKKIARKNSKIIFSRTKNNGVIAARNSIIRKCKTSHLLFCDPDDELSLDYLKAAEELLLNNRGIEIIYPEVVVRNALKEKLWITGPFDSEILQSVNTIPMSSICAIEVFRDLNGFSADFEKGFEDWDFWYRASLSGVKALPLKEVGYFYSEKPKSRSSEAALYANQLEDQIALRTLGPIQHGGLSNQIEIFIFAPWFIRGGGVDSLLERMLEHFVKKKVALVTTEKQPAEYISAITEQLNKKILVIEKSRFANQQIFLKVLQTLASKNALIINLGSDWAFDNSTFLSTFVKHHFAWVFNHFGVSRVSNCPGTLTEIWPVYERLYSELKDLNKKKTPIALIYVGIQNELKPKVKKLARKNLMVGWIGRLSPEKDPLKFIYTAKMCGREEFKFTIAGDGPLRKDVLRNSNKLKNFKYLGFAESSHGYIQGLDILMLTSSVEGIPLVAMEALQLGVYVIAPNIGGIPDLISDKKDGLLYDGSKKDLLRALEEARLIILAKQASPKLGGNFSEEKMFKLIDSRIAHYRKPPRITHV
jgi:glycosyltransferase involved in cell wall biosynthesis